jgi:hypothetical protein
MRVTVPRQAAFDRPIASKVGAGKRWTRIESRGKYIFLFNFIKYYY